MLARKLMAAPESGVVFTDDFNRSDETLTDSPNWEITASRTGTSVDVVSNECVFEYTQAYKYRAVNYTGALSDDQYAEVEVSALPASGDYTVNVFVRATVNGNTDEREFYTFGYDTGPSLWKIHKSIAGSATDLDTNAVTPAVTAGDVISIEVSGTSIVGRVNGAIVCSATDSELTSGYAGMYMYIANSGRFCTVDNFECGDL